jgi:hypothetical protein
VEGTMKRKGERLKQIKTKCRREEEGERGDPNK